jgi:hypothetical protein
MFSLFFKLGKHRFLTLLCRHVRGRGTGICRLVFFGSLEAKFTQLSKGIIKTGKFRKDANIISEKKITEVALTSHIPPLTSLSTHRN